MRKLSLMSWHKAFLTLMPAVIAMQGRLYAAFLAALEPFDLRLHSIVRVAQDESAALEMGEFET